MLTRRKFVLKGGKLVLAMSSMPLSTFSSTFTEPHIQIANLIKKKWGKKNQSLNLLHPKGSLANVTAVAQEFKKLTGITVNLREVGTADVASEILLERLMGKGSKSIDVALPASFTIPDLVEAKSIIDLTPFAQVYEPVGLMESSLYNLGDRYKGDLYGYQCDGDAYMLFYNKQWLEDIDNQKRFKDRFGKKLDVPMTWDDLDKQMQFFHNPDKNRYGGSLFRNRDYTAWEFWTRFHSKGFFPVDDDFNPQFNNASGLEALEELVDATKYLEPGVLGNNLFQNFEAFTKGNTFCNLGWGGSQKAFNKTSSPLKGKLGYAPLPGGKINGQVYQMPYFNWGWNYVVSSYSTNVELSYLFCLFATTPKVSTSAVREKDGFFDPYRDEHYEDQIVQEIYSKEFLSAHKKSLITSIPDFYVRGQGRYFSTLKQAVHAAAFKQISPKLALNKVSRNWQEITKDLGVKEQRKQWRFLKSSYPASLAKVLK
ncbi:MAG: extracellular solute-binding protein [Bacteriovoracaceae bacterium]|nr:extracellular solute-binding protein [Bacteriovoracaceae bacterium]